MGAACASSDRKLLARSVADGQATGRLRLAIIVSDSSLVEMTAINDHVQQPAPSLSPPGLPQGGGERYREDKDQGAGHLRLSTTVFWPGSAARRRAARLLDVLYCSLHLSSCLRGGSRVRAGGRGEVDGLPGLQRSAGSLAQPAPHGQTTRTFHPCSRPRPVCPAARHGQTSWLTALGQARASWTDCMAYSARRARRPRLPCRRAVDGLLVPGLLLPRSEGSQQQSRRLSRRVGDGLPCYLLGGRSRRSGSLIGPAAGAS